MSDTRWWAKLAAWTHDPAEKALILLRGGHGHEDGTVRALRREIFGDGGPDAVEIVRRADRWASAADRPDRPKDDVRSEADRTAWWKRPVLIHPLCGTEFDLGSLEGVAPAAAESVSQAHFEPLVARRDGKVDPAATFLRFWRLGPEIRAKEIRSLWRLLPADTRVPGHSIWDHLRLASAFAGAMADGGSPALLECSLGPVQSFISTARSTSDLWAGSHLLSALAWEAMRVVCEGYGPDAILFPDLHGVPLVDLWLAGRGVPFDDLHPAWMHSASDANPLFAALLPNRFVALVPEGAVADLAGAIRDAVRKRAADLARTAWTRLLAEAKAEDSAGFGAAQIDAQLAEFPEFHWAAVPWSLVDQDASGHVKSDSNLRRALEKLRPGPSFLEEKGWQILSKALRTEAFFYEPNPGVLYPALYELLNAAMAQAKAVRPFAQAPATGYRCSLCGEAEWLTNDRSLLERHGASGVWMDVANARPSWARERERLCARCALKRMWPVLFVDEVRDHVADGNLDRYVVSTHTMALAPTLRDLAKAPPDKIESLKTAVENKSRVALPRELHAKAEAAGRGWLARIPAALEEGDEERLRALRKAVGKAVDGGKVEDYYALVLMDGDHMGAWLTEPGLQAKLARAATWHPDARVEAEAIAAKDAAVRAYLDEPAPVSPAYHGAISGALAAFSGELVRAVVEDLHLGKVLYSGGDDVLAMLGIDDLLSAMTALRCAWSGVAPAGAAVSVAFEPHRNRLWLAGGFARLDGRLLRTMGPKATASIGAVVAHHMAPLGSVLRGLRAAEHRAKTEGDRNAFSVSLMKRSGGLTRFTCRWSLAEHDPPGFPMDVLLRLRDYLAGSRRAAYHIQAWLPGIPPAPGADGPEGYRKLLADNLAWQMKRQLRKERADLRDGLLPLAEDLARLALDAGRGNAPGFLGEALVLAEFLARNGRAGEAGRARGN